MPVLSSFISYKPKRKTKQPIKVSSPFNPITTATGSPHHLPLSPHPYASPPRVININDGRLPPLTANSIGSPNITSPNVTSPNISEPSPSPYYRTNLSTPRVQLNIEQEPLTDWFPAGFLKSNSELGIGVESNGASGNGTYYGAGYKLSDPKLNKNIDYLGQNVRNDELDEGTGGQDSRSVTSEEEEVEEGDVLANLDLIGSSGYPHELEAVTADTQNVVDDTYHTPKKHAPSPIKIPSYHNQNHNRDTNRNVGYGSGNNGAPKVQLVDLSSRPTSQISTPESSAISGTTLARALIANTFGGFSGSHGHGGHGGGSGGHGGYPYNYGPRHRGSTGSGLSNESLRTSRYRSGGSNLTRTDSATLPKAEFASAFMPISPPLPQPLSSGSGTTASRDGRASLASLDVSGSLSPGSAGGLSSPGSGPGVPPIPGNAELVYVPPQMLRPGIGDKRKTTSTLATVGSAKSDAAEGSVGSGPSSSARVAEEDIGDADVITATATVTTLTTATATITNATRKISRISEVPTTTTHSSQPSQPSTPQLAYMEPEAAGAGAASGTSAEPGTGPSTTGTSTTEGRDRRPKTPPPETRPKEPLPRRPISPELEVPAPLVPSDGGKNRRQSMAPVAPFTTSLAVMPPVPVSSTLPIVEVQALNRGSKDSSDSNITSNTNSVILMSPPSSSEDPLSGRDFDYVLDYYASPADVAPPTQFPLPAAASHVGPSERNNNSNFRLPFSPITEESSSQLSPPTPFRSEALSPRNSLLRQQQAATANTAPGRFFVGSTPGASINGVRVDWNVRSSSESRSSRRSSSTSRAAAALPSSDRPGARTPSNSSSHSRTNLSISSTSSAASLPQQDGDRGRDRDQDNKASSSSSSSLQPPQPSNLFNRLRSGSAPSPIKVVRNTRDLSAYNITMTPRAAAGGSSDSTPTTAESGGNNEINIQQTFPETPSAFSPGFSPASSGIISPGMRVSGSMAEYLSMGVPQTPQSAFLPGIGIGGIRPSLDQQVLLTRAATSVRGARHSRQASLGRQLRQQQEQEKERERGKASHPYARAELLKDTTRDDDVAAGAQEVAASASGNLGDASVAGKDSGGSDTTTANHSHIDRNSTILSQGPRRADAQDIKPLAVTLTRADSGREKPLPDKPAPSPQSMSATSPVVSEAYSSYSSPPEPAAPVLPSVSLPSLTPSPPTQTYLPPEPTELPTPRSLKHGSEEAVLAYDDAEARSLDLPAANSRTPGGLANKRSNASISVDEESSMRSTNVIRFPQLPPVALIPPAPTTTPPIPPMEIIPASVRSTGGPSASTSSVSLNSTNESTPRPKNSSMQPMQRQELRESSVSNSPRPSFRRPDMIHPPPSDIQIPPAQTSASSLYSHYDVAMSPPSYYAVINSDKAAAAEVRTPSTGGSYDVNYKFGGGSSGPGPGPGPTTPVVGSQQNRQQHSPPPNAGEFVVGSSRGSMAPSTASNKRPRYRPPLPAGPRRPSQQHVSGTAGHQSMRERGGSVSSVGSQLPSSRRAHSTPLTSPKFQTPIPKYRGYTMDAAKWTFTSTQLQAIVSRAIRQSSEASSIRLLKLETLDGEIQEEIERLVIARTETIAKFKTLTRRRTALFDGLVSSIDRVDPEGPGHTLRLIDDLKEIATAHDRLAEELHSADEQLAQLKQLCQSHSTSALAMALRKLNASFLKQFSETQSLRQQVETLETERDEAWKEAETIAYEYEDLRAGRIESPPDDRYNRVVAVRKSSVRAIRQAALLGGHSRSNQRASTGSSNRAFGAITPSSARTTAYVDDVPPMPHVPPRRPVDIKTNLPSRSSTLTGGSTEGMTPTSETRAMVRAQEELYDMLGITLNDSRTRRSHSVIGVPGEPEMTQPVVSPRYMTYEAAPNTGRRASLPDSAALPPHPYDALADVSIIITSDDRGAGWF